MVAQVGDVCSVFVERSAFAPLPQGVHAQHTQSHAGALAVDDDHAPFGIIGGNFLGGFLARFEAPRHRRGEGYVENVFAGSFDDVGEEIVNFRSRHHRRRRGFAALEHIVELPEGKISACSAVVVDTVDDVTERQHREIVFGMGRREIGTRVGCNKVRVHAVNIAHKTGFCQMRG